MKTTELSQNLISDLSRQGRNTQTMSAISREEFNAKIETIEARMDARLEGVSARFDAFLSAQAERDNTRLERDQTQAERDKRYDLMWAGVQKIAEESKEAIKQASTVKANYWAATAVHFFGVITIVVAAHFANQAAVLTTLQTTLAAIQLGKDISVQKPASLQIPVPPQ